MCEEQFQFAGCTIRIIQDSDAPNPRDDYGHLGKMVFFDSREYRSRNEWKHSENMRDFESALRSLAWFCTRSDAMEDEYRVSMDHVLRAVNKHFVIVPIYRNDRMGYVFGSGDGAGESDERCDGLVFFPVADLQGEGIDRERAVKILEGEIEEYSSWATGDCYGYVIEDENGDELDSCWGFYGQDYAIESAKESAKSQRYSPAENV